LGGRHRGGAAPIARRGRPSRSTATGPGTGVVMGHALRQAAPTPSEFSLTSQSSCLLSRRDKHSEYGHCNRHGR
jgi:hypothetical protein